jgi:hypothetical protein
LHVVFNPNTNQNLDNTKKVVELHIESVVVVIAIICNGGGRMSRGL